MNVRFFIINLLLIVLATQASAQGMFPDRYHTYQEVLDTLADLRDSFPQIMHLDTLGYSNRDTIPIIRVKISDNPQLNEDEPAVFFNGGVHADEILSVEVVLNFIQDIIAGYSQGDTAIIRYIQNLEILVLPFVNPEGHLVVELGDLDWRKNKSDNDTNGVFDYHDGVDNNRNYDFGWNIDDDAAATTPESLMFKGYYPFSQSENRALRDFGWQYRPLVAIDYHSPTYGRPNVAYYPWYWYSSDGGHGPGPDENLMKTICQEFCELILAVPDTTGNPSGMYETRRALVNKGDFKTYYYGNFGTAAFAVEISDTTIQDTVLVDSIVAAHLPGQYYLLQRALGPGITGIIRDSVSLTPLEAEVRVLEHINDDINPRLSRPDFGRYRRLLAPDSYTLRFIKDGYVTKTIYNVVVDTGGPTNTDVLLSPVNPVPPAPQLVLPADEAIIDDEYVDFIWHGAATATGYIIEIAGDELFQSIVIYDSSLSDTTYENPTPLNDGTYYWRVTAYNINGYSQRSMVRTFEIQLSAIPEPPVLILPLDEAIIDTEYIDFFWHESALATGYVMEIAGDEPFDSLFIADSSVTDTSYRNGILLVDGFYYWRVAAYNGNGYSEHSSIRSFNVQLISIPVPVLQCPGDGYVSASPHIYFNWLDVDGAEAYLIEISPNIAFDSVAICDSTLAQSEYTNSDSLPNGTYYWRVKASIAPNWGDYCTPREFYVDVDTSGISYVPGDVNGDTLLRGSDVTFLVNYFRGTGDPPPIQVNGFYPGADANGDCRNIGSDVTYLINYFRGGDVPLDGHCF